MNELNQLIQNEAKTYEIKKAINNGLKANEKTLSLLYRTVHLRNRGNEGENKEDTDLLDTAMLIAKNGGTFDEYTRNILSQPLYKLTKLQIDQLESLANKNNLETPKNFPSLRTLCINNITKIKFFPDKLNQLPDELLIDILGEKISQIHTEEEIKKNMKKS